MEITNVKVRVIDNANPKMKAFCSVTFDDELVVHDIRILEGNNGLMIAFPNKQITPGEFKDTVHPINQATRDKFTKAVLAEYERVLNEGNN